MAKSEGQHDHQTNTDKKQAKEKILLRNFWKNTIVISVGFFFFFMGYFPINAVQSSLNNAQGLGMAALSTKYGFEAFGNLVTNNYMVNKLGCKWSISSGMLLYSTYIAANFYPQWSTLIPCAIVTGLGAATMWMAQGLYLTKCCNAYLKLKSPNLSKEQFEARLASLKYIVFGVFNFFYFASNGVGNLASSLILPMVTNNTKNNVTEARLKMCGAAYCNQVISTNENPEDIVHVYGLCTFCMSSAIIGIVLITLFADRLPKMGIPNKSDIQKTTLQRVTATVKHWRYPYQLLLIPLGLYSGMNAPFWTAEFTKSVVTCTVGVHYVGFVIVCYGVTAPISVCIFSWISKKNYRAISYIFGMTAHLSVLVTMLLWKPTPDDLPIFYVLSAIWGLGYGVWFPMLYAFYSVVFQKDMESAFSNFHLWYTFGNMLSYSWSYSLCVYVKIYIMMFVIIFGVICFVTIEIHLAITSKKDDSEILSSNEHEIVETTKSNKNEITACEENTKL